MTKRKKPEPPIVIGTNDQANDVLRELAELERKLATIDAGLNEQIDRLKAVATEQAEPLRERQTALAVSLEAYGQRQREELFAKAKTVKLPFGAFGFRRSTSIGTARGWKLPDVIAACKALGGKAAEAVRVKESLDREALRDWTDEELAQVGTERKSKDTFWYEVDQQAVAEAVQS